MVSQGAKRFFAHFMTWLERPEVAYDEHTEFVVEQYTAIKANDVARFLKLLVFDDANISLEHAASPDVLCKARLNTILTWKSQLSSCCMVNQNMPWDETVERGNPTRATVINDILAVVKKKEMRDQGGLKSKARRPLKQDEWIHIVEHFHAQPDYKTRYGFPAFLAVQFALIARGGCTSQLKKAHLVPHDQYPNIALKARLPWTLNQEEGDAPFQILLGAMNPLFCVMTNLGLWLETVLRNQPGAAQSPYVFCFNNDHRIPQGGQKIQSRFALALATLFKMDPWFAGRNPEELGTHSGRKAAADYARGCGVSLDDRDYRGRWMKKRVSSRCENVEMPFIDAKVAAVLCVDGACAYVIPEGSPVTPEFIPTYVTPTISECFGDAVGQLLGRAVLWLCFSEHNALVPSFIRNRVALHYQQLFRTGAFLANPIARRPIVVSGNAAVLNLTILDEIGNQADGQGGGTQPTNHQAVGDNLQMNQILQLLTTIQQQQLATNSNLASLQAQFETRFNDVTTLTDRLLTAINRINRQPHQIRWQYSAQQGNQVQQEGGLQLLANAAAAPPANRHAHKEASLSPRPKTLYDLWTEWSDGIGGRKPARLFTPTERGHRKVKTHFCRRKLLWHLVRDLCRVRNWTPDVAIDNIYQVYGQNKTVTEILKALRVARNTGNYHPNLAI